MATNNSSNLPIPVTVANGGTGATTLTSHGVLVGNGSSPISAIAVGAANSILMGNTGSNPAFTTSGTPYVSGISFDSGSNTLSTYNNGTFSPTVVNTSTPPTITYSSQLGRYTSIGNRIIINMRIVVTAYTAGTGTVQIGALPFTSNNTSNNNNIFSGNVSNVTYGASVSYYVGSVAANTAVMDVVGILSGGGPTNLVAAGPVATFILNFTGVYQSP